MTRLTELLTAAKGNRKKKKKRLAGMKKSDGIMDGKLYTLSFLEDLFAA